MLITENFQVIPKRAKMNQIHDLHMNKLGHIRIFAFNVPKSNGLSHAEIDMILFND